MGKACVVQLKQVHAENEAAAASEAIAAARRADAAEVERVRTEQLSKKLAQEVQQLIPLGAFRSFHPMAQCAVHVLSSPALHARGCARPSRTRRDHTDTIHFQWVQNLDTPR